MGYVVTLISFVKTCLEILQLGICYSCDLQRNTAKVFDGLSLTRLGKNFLCVCKREGEGSRQAGEEFPPQPLEMAPESLEHSQWALQAVN